MIGLTKRQSEILAFIEASVAERGYPPTRREIGRAMGIRSTNGVQDHIAALERKGRLVRTDMYSRGITVIARAPEVGPVAELADECAREAVAMLQARVGEPLTAEVADAVCDLLRLCADSYAAAIGATPSPSQPRAGERTESAA